MALSQSLAELVGLSLRVRRAGRRDIDTFVGCIDTWSPGDPGHLGSNQAQISQRVSLLVNPALLERFGSEILVVRRAWRRVAFVFLDGSIPLLPSGGAELRALVLAGKPKNGYKGWRDIAAVVERAVQDLPCLVVIAAPKTSERLHKILSDSAFYSMGIDGHGNEWLARCPDGALPSLIEDLSARRRGAV